MFKYISDIIAQFSTPQKIIALSMILLSIVIISIAPSLIDDKADLKNEITEKKSKIKILEDDLRYKDSLIRNEQKNCTDQILQREKEFISMLDYLSNKAKKEDNKIISQTNMESFPVIIQNPDSISYYPSPQTTSIIVKNDMGNIINEIEKVKKKVKN